MRKKFLEKRLQRLQEKRNKINSLVDASTEVAEVRSLTAQLEDLDAEISEVREELALIETEERAAEPVKVSDPVPAGAQRVGGKVVGSFKTEEERGEMLGSMEYRMAFKAYVQKQTPIPAEFRSGDAIDTVDTGAAIPLTIMREVINTVRKRYGNLYDKVRKLSVQGGVEFPIGELEADFHWITEDTVSPDQELDALADISFKYFTAEIRIAQTFLQQIVTLEDFEAKIVEVIALAYRKAMDKGIVKGTGVGQMTGIINDSRIANLSGHTITMTAADMGDWKKWRTKFFKAIPLGYRGGEFIFSLPTVDAYLETLSDDNNRPLYREVAGLEVDDGDAADPRGRFFGREVSIVENDVLPSFDDANANDVIGIYWYPNEYAINENFGFTMRKYFDENRNKWINKALVVVDGKPLNPYAFFLIKKGS